MGLVTVLAGIVVDAALGIWLGSIVFFSFIGAPQTFAVLDTDRAGRVVNAIFPRYYVFGIALGVVALVGTGVIAVSAGIDSAIVGVIGVIALGVGLNGYARWILIPKMDAAGEAAFERYHRRSVILNGVTMLAVAVGLVGTHL
ncbi:MAG: DUF4149 domain-containing protein [Halobacteriales archaeon]